jgi:predicted Zn-dependent protease
LGRFVLLYLVIGLVMGLAACAPQLDPEESCNFVQNSLKRRVSWATQPITVGVEDTLPSYFHDEIKSAIATWERVLGNSELFVDDLKTITRNEVDQVNISLLWELDWQSTPAAETSQDPSAVEQAKTSIAFQSDNLYRAMIFFNAAQNEFSVVKEPGRTHLASVALHEIGHALGLYHIDNKKAVMYPKLKTNTIRMEPSEMDITSLQCEY